MAVKKKIRTPEEQAEINRKRKMNLRPFTSENARARQQSGVEALRAYWAKRRDLKEFYSALLSTDKGQKLVDDAIVRSFKVKNPVQALKVADEIMHRQSSELRERVGDTAEDMSLLNQLLKKEGE